MAGGTTISTYENGPFLVMGGPFRLVDAHGDEFSVKKATIELCRCGASAKKPSCDRTHSKIGFRAAQRTVQATTSLVEWPERLSLRPR